MKKSLIRKLSVLALCLMAVLALAACGASQGSEELTTEEALKISAEKNMKVLGNQKGEGESLNTTMTDITDLEDLITLNYVYLTVDTTEMKEYQVIYYGGTSNILKAVHSETHFFKDAGYTEDIIKQINVDDIYPGFSDLSFTKTHYEDMGDYFCYIIEYNELDNPDHLDQLYDCNCKLISEKGTGKCIAADSYRDLLVDAGATEASVLDVHSENPVK